MKSQCRPRSVRLPWIGALLAAWQILAPVPTGAQESRATITGQVVDPTGAAVPGAAVKAIQLDTQQAYTATCDDAGVYSLPYLQPGRYSVSIEAGGFQKTVYSNVVLDAAQKLNLNATLTLGSIDQEVTVSAAPGLLDTAAAGVGGVVDQAQVVNMPGTGRLAWDDLSFAQGVRMLSAGFNTTPRGSGETYTVSGTPTNANAYYLNGAPVSDQGVYHFTPSLDAIQELQGGIEYDAQYSRAGGGSFNVTVKQGTNSYHGDFFDYYGNKILNSNTYANNLGGVAQQENTRNNFGAVFGGPIRKNKTFFFGSYEAWRQANPQSATDSVPPSAWRTGDFSQSGYSIYDPLSSTCSATNAQGQCTTYKRTQFPNNIIPSNRISPIGQAIVNQYPAPKNAANTNNYPTAGVHDISYDQWLGRIDQYFSENTRLYALGSTLRNWAYLGGNGFTGVPSTENTETGFPFMGIVALTHVFSPSLVADTKLSFARYNDATVYGQTIQQNFTGDKIGGLHMPDVPTTTHLNLVPQVAVTGYTTIFDNTDNGTVDNNWNFNATLSQVKGRHNLHYGVEFSDVQSGASGVPGRPNGTFTFNVGWTQSNPLTAANGQGSAVATLLLGYPNSGSVDWNSNQFVTYRYYGLYVQDDYKLRRNLTVNLGLRWDVNLSAHERFNSINAGFCYTCSNPYTKQINYAPYPGLPNPLTGGWQFAGVNGVSSAPFQTQYNHWQPRVGISWAVTDKWVVRAGYGIFYSWSTLATNSQGFNQSTSYISSLDGNLTPTNYFLIGTPYPNGVLAPSGSTAGLATQAGQAISYVSPDRKLPYTQRWSIGIQRALPQKVLLDAEYVGSHTHALPVSTAWDVVPLSQQAACFQNNALCNANVSNPFYGVLPAAAALGASTTVQAYQLNRPWPLFNGITQSDDPAGESDYHALDVRLERKIDNLDFVANYSFSNWMEETSYLNNANFRDVKPWRGLDSNDRRHYLSVSMIWPLPFGKGGWVARNAHGVEGAVIGGWITDSTVLWGTGTPLAIPSADFYGPGCTGYAPAGGQDDAHWLNNNMSCWHNLLPWEARTAPLNVGYLRNPGGLLTWNPALYKMFALPREGMFAQLRIDALRGANETALGNPNETLATLPTFTPWVGWTGFGTSTLGGGNRVVTISLKILF